jgi:hypothetical protein
MIGKIAYPHDFGFAPDDREDASRGRGR